MSYVTGRLLNVPNVNDIQKQINELNDKTTELENTKQDKLVSGENIKTVDGNSIVGPGNVPFKTLNGEQLSGEGNIDIHNEPLTIKTGLSSGDVIYDGTEAVEVEISPITVTTEPVEYTYDSQLKFYREPTENEEQLGSIYYIGADQPITTTVQITNKKIHDPIDADGILKVFTAPFTDIFTEQEIEVSSKACTYVKKANQEESENVDDTEATADPITDAYLQFGNNNDASGWIKLRLNKKQAYLWIKAKMFNVADYPGSIFVADNLSKLTDIDFSASEAADKLVFNYPETLVDSVDDWQVIKVPVKSESQTIYITNGRNFGTPSGPSTTYDYKRDEDGHIIWTRDPETGEITGGDIDRDNPLYGGRILIKEIGIQYEEELGPKTLFTAEQFAAYKANADYRFTNIEAVNEAQSSYLDEIDTHLNRVDEEFTEKFNNLGDVQIYTVAELPSQVHADDKNKIFKYEGHYYVVDINQYDDNTAHYIFSGNEHAFDDNINSVSSLIKSFNKIYDDNHETTLKSNFWIPDDSVTQENKLFGSGNTYTDGTGQDVEDLLGNQYLRFGSSKAGGKLILEYRDSSNTKALTHISFKLLPWIGVTSIVDPETGERAKHIASLNKSAIKIYRNTEDNLIDAAEIDCGSIELDDYDYSAEGFASLVDDYAKNLDFEIQLMPGDSIIIKSDNNVTIGGEELDYRFFILGINITTENTHVEFKEPFVTTDTNQDNITGAKTFTNNFTIEHVNSGAGLSVSDAVYMYGYKEIFGNTTVFGTIDFERNTNFYGITEFHTNPIFWDNIQIKSDISNGFDKSITVSEISTATNLENSNGNGSIIQGNVELGNITWISSDTNIATVDENGNVEAVGEGDVTITAIAENGASDECALHVVNPDRVNLMGSWNTTTVNTTIADYAANHNWEDNTAYNEIILDNNITVNITNQDSYTGKYFVSSNDWRIYQSDAGSFEVRCSDTTKTIKTVKITYTSANSGIVVYNDAQYTSGSIIEVEAVSASMAFTVNRTGGTKQGQAKITAIEVVYGSYEPTLVEEITLNATELDLNTGAQYLLEADVLPDEADNRDVIWSSSDTSVATVIPNGALCTVKAISAGEATITVSAVDGSGVSNSCAVSVTGATIKEIQLNVNRATINLGEEIKLSVKYKDKNIADGDLAIALGLESEAHGDRSFVQGDHLVANEDNQVIFGSYNAQTDAKFVIAAGTENERFNALEVTAEGKVIAGVQTDDSDDDEVLTTKSYVDAKTGGSGSITIGNTNLTEAQLQKLIALLDTLEAKDIE